MKKTFFMATKGETVTHDLTRERTNYLLRAARSRGSKVFRVGKAYLIDDCDSIIVPTTL